MDKDYYSPREIMYDKDTSLWVIHNFGSLRSGYWPADASNYTDAPIGKRAVKAMGAFVTPVECAAELTTRMEK